jgi:hypothetical protein
MRRSRRWIELRATAGTGSAEPERRDEGQHPGSPEDERPAVPGPEPEGDEVRDVAPPSPSPPSPSPSPSPSSTPFSELTSLAARMAMAPILESGRYFRAVTAHNVRSAPAEQADDND